jgi:hypothetical protein
MLRSLSAAVLALAICACEPKLPQVPPTPTVTAVFDPTAAQIPLPNDLVFIPPVNSVCPPPGNAMVGAPACAQAELLASFAGAFPSDQELALTIDFTENTYDVNGRVKLVAPDLDLTTITPATLFVIGTVGSTTGPMPLDPITDDDYVVAMNADGTPADHGTLSLHHQGRAPWPTGAYSLVMRGGDSGVKTKATADTPAIPVTPSPVFDLVEQGKDMTAPENLGLLKAQANGSTAAALAQGQQLNLLIALYKGADPDPDSPSVFHEADKVFPHEQMAIASTFKIGPTVTNVTVDPARGLAPLPIDLLRDATTHKLTPVAACTLAGSSLDKNGNCPNPAAAGFLTLDGFSTTGAILAPTSDLIQASTVTPSSLRLYDLSDPKTAVLVPAGSLIVEPCEFTSACNSPTALSPVIAFQPAGATAGDPTSLFRTRPLKDNTDYAVVVTTDIKDKAGNPIGPGTVAKILRFQNALAIGGHSALQGIDDATASSLEAMRKQLPPVFTALGPDAGKVAMAYTFHTQTVLSPAVQLAALPYTAPAATGLPISTSLKVEIPADAFTKFGVPAGVPNSDIDQILEADITTFNALDPATGAFLPDPTKAALETIHVLIATPKPAAAPNCPAAPNPLSAFTKCAPLMVFRHGLGRGRVDMLLIANSFAKAGMATVAIDAAKHGDRTLCSSGAGASSGCVGVCTKLAMAEGQGDLTPPGPPGTCDAMGLAKKGLDGTPVTSPDKDGIPAVSGNYLVSANFFRTRDTLRQDLIDESQLIRVMAFAPTGAPPTGHVVFDEILTHAVTTTGTSLIIDPTTVYFSGQSLGAIQGTLDVATNPRISKAGLNVGGGTITDIFTNSPAFAPQVNALLAGLGIDRVNDPSKFLQFLTVAKTVLDPADPANFAGHLTASTLPNLLPPLGGNPNGAIPQAAKKILTQVANCDQVVPNPFGMVWASNVPTGPLPPNMFAPGSTGTLQLFVGPAFNPVDFLQADKCSDTTAAEPLAAGGGHGFLTDFGNPALTLKGQTDLANFVTNDTLPLSVQQ